MLKATTRYAELLERSYWLDTVKPNLGSVIIELPGSSHEFQVDTVDRICQLMNRAYVNGHTVRREPTKKSSDIRGIRY